MVAQFTKNWGLMSWAFGNVGWITDIPIFSDLVCSVMMSKEIQKGFGFNNKKKIRVISTTTTKLKRENASNKKGALVVMPADEEGLFVNVSVEGYANGQLISNITNCYPPTLYKSVDW
uniref:Inner membrane protein n=1 Tax=Rhabditophanes sp. KR3021 TaxID=114890 RepID=A0AC35UF15_9BILA